MSEPATASALILAFQQDGMASVLGRIIAKTIIAQLPKVVAASINGADIRLELENGKSIDLAPALAQTLSEMSPEEITEAMSRE